MQIILLWKPKSTQNMYGDSVLRTKGRTITMKYLKKDAKALKEDYIKQMKRQYNGDPILSDVAVRIEVRWYWAEPDRDNVHKLSMDAWNWVIRMDDKQIISALVMKMWKDNKNPRLVLHIEEECRVIQR